MSTNTKKRLLAIAIIIVLTALMLLTKEFTVAQFMGYIGCIGILIDPDQLE